MPKQTTWPNSFCSQDWVNWMKNMTFEDNEVSLCFNLADLATFLASNSALWTLFSSENSLLNFFSRTRTVNVWTCSERESKFKLCFAHTNSTRILVLLPYKAGYVNKLAIWLLHKKQYFSFKMCLWVYNKLRKVGQVHASCMFNHI